MLHVGLITVHGTKIDDFKSSTKLSIIMTQAVIILLYLAGLVFS